VGTSVAVDRIRVGQRPIRSEGMPQSLRDIVIDVMLSKSTAERCLKELIRECSVVKMNRYGKNYYKVP